MWVNMSVKLWFGLALSVGLICTSLLAMDPEEVEDNAVTRSGLALSDKQGIDRSGYTGSKKLSLDVIPQTAAELERAFRACQARVCARYVPQLVQALRSESQSAAQDPTGKELPNLGLALFDAEAHGSRIGKALASVPPQDKDRMLKSALDKIGFFAAKGGSRLASVAETIEGLQHENMYRLILQALGEGAHDLTYVQKSALQHQFLGYEVYYKDEVKKDAWLGRFNKVWGAGTDGGLLAFINNTYQEITAQTEAIDTDHYWVVRHSQLAGLKDHINDLLPANNDDPQPTIVIDIDAAGDVFNMAKEDLPERLQNLVLTNADESMQTIGDKFLDNRNTLQTLHLNLPVLKSVGDEFLEFCFNLKNLYLNLPALQEVGKCFLGGRNEIEKLRLNLPTLHKVEDFFLCGCGKLENLYLNLPALQEAGACFLIYCTNLTKLDLNAPALRKVGDSFLAYLESLVCFKLSLPTLTEIGNRLLYDSNVLEKLYLKLPLVKDFKDSFLFNCNKLEEFYVDLDALQKVGHSFMFNSSGKLEIYVPEEQLENLKKIFPAAKAKSLWVLG